jgi:hypothetical protein
MLLLTVLLLLLLPRVFGTSRTSGVSEEVSEKQPARAARVMHAVAFTACKRFAIESVIMSVA